MCYVMGIDRNTAGSTQTVQTGKWMELRNGQLQNFDPSLSIFRMI